LTRAVLRRHFAASRPEHVIGLHSTSPGNTCLWGALDIDWHGPTSTAPALNLAAALAWYGKLRRLGFLPLLTDTNGAGGFHLLTLFSAAVPAAKVFSFLRWLARDHGALGLPSPPETFPKQPRIEPGRYGNWLRLPGRHHTREHWSRVWDGWAWLEGDAAVAHVLSLAGDSPELIPAEALSVQPRPFTPCRSSAAPRVPPEGQLDRRIRAYLEKLPAGLGAGQHRDDYGFRFACFLVRDPALSDADALPWMRQWDGRNAAPKGEDALRGLLANARRYGHNPIGSGLDRLTRVRPARASKHGLTRMRFTVEV
jgi:hypothetical protein